MFVCPAPQGAAALAGLSIMEQRKFRVWRPAIKRMDYFLVGQEAAIGDDDVVMIGSGFEDKNGREVYENDIVTGDSRGTLDMVVFSCGCFCLSKATMHYEATYWGKEIEIKGNAFETPEVLDR